MSHQAAQALLTFIDQSPSPWHAVANLASRLDSQGFTELRESEAWALKAGARHYVVRDQSSIIAFVVGDGALEQHGFRIIGAHTDSPGLRVKPNAPHTAGPMVRLGVEVYGGPILATFTDRDLSLAGRVSLRSGPCAFDVASRLVHFEQPLVRIPNLAIHMNRAVNDEGLKLHKQRELPMMLSVVESQLPAAQGFNRLLAEQLGVDGKDILAFELAVCDTQKGAFFGPNREFFANSQLDNLASCHAGTEALLDSLTQDAAATRVIAFFDHEEVGSTSHKGADSSFLEDCLERIALAAGLMRGAYKQALAQSYLLSADMAHAYHPNYAEYYDAEHQAVLNQGPVIKHNHNVRYATDGLSAAFFLRLCELAEVPCQKYVHRNDIPCGSTIGPLAGAGLGLRAVDVGNPMWSMHSLRESAGTFDHGYMIKAMRQFFWSTAHQA
ncbi:MAG: M18 family aminopeptidase [Gammaproteobacteria bacterium]|nr:M18 family aminopeptidase [Gammaproteobacteria bacterium]